MKILPQIFSTEQRIAMGARCKDCDDVPKVADAGIVYEDATGQRVQVMHNGLRVRADGYYGEWMTNLIQQCKGHHEPQEERAFHEIMRHLPHDATMIELGGFWSYYSLWFLMDSPMRRSVVLEPDPEHLAVGRANAAMNSMAPKFVQGFAGADFQKSVLFPTETSGTVKLNQYSVKKLMDQHGITKLNLLHCDIQGAETAVLNACRTLFTAGRVDWVIVSTHAHAISGDPLTHQRCLDILRQCGARIEVEHDVHESFSGDGLIVARFCPRPDKWQPIKLSYNRHSQALFRSLAYDLAESQKMIADLNAKLLEIR